MTEEYFEKSYVDWLIYLQERDNEFHVPYTEEDIEELFNNAEDSNDSDR